MKCAHLLASALAFPLLLSVAQASTTQDAQNAHQDTQSPVLKAQTPDKPPGTIPEHKPAPVSGRDNGPVSAKTPVPGPTQSPDQQPTAIAPHTPAPVAEMHGEDALIARGHYLAIAADCAACHTNPYGGKAYAGGYGIASPLGTIYSTNITPSKSDGIGTYTLKQFTAALRDGIRGDGAHLYPAMPYTSYTHLSDVDVRALYEYFMHGVQPVDHKPPVTHLPFPFGIRASMAFWNLLYLDHSPLKAPANASDEVRRGQYLTIALAHCDTCHTPRGQLMAEKSSRPFAGASLASWYAPNITNGPAGIADWSDNDLFQYLKTGDVPGRSQAAGPMAEAVEHSFQYLTDTDLHDIVTYVRTLEALPDQGQTLARDSFGKPGDREAALRGLPMQDHGEWIYQSECAACHRPDGKGSPDHYYPQLFHNSVTGANTPTNLIAAILLGVDRTVDGKRVYMPGFGPGSFVQTLSDHDVADVANYVLRQFGNTSASVTPADVALVRAGGPKPLIARLGPFIAPAMGVGGVAVVLIAALLLLRRRKRSI